MFAGEYVCWNYLTVKCADIGNATQLLAEHGRCAHRLQEQVCQCPLAKADTRRVGLPCSAVAQRVQEIGLPTRAEASITLEEVYDPWNHKEAYDQCRGCC